MSISDYQYTHIEFILQVMLVRFKRKS